MNQACFSVNTTMQTLIKKEDKRPLKNNFPKKICFFTIVCLVVLQTGCQNHGLKENAKTGPESNSGAAFMYFANEGFSAGKIIQGEKVAHSFTLENRGKSDLIIFSVNPSCGCTVAKWDKKPIAPGKSVSIDVVFDSKGKIGLQHKTIVVESNAKPESKILSLACEVVLPNNSKIE
jgi:hypothetical protein